MCYADAAGGDSFRKLIAETRARDASRAKPQAASAEADGAGDQAHDKAHSPVPHHIPIRSSSDSPAASPADSPSSTEAADQAGGRSAAAHTVQQDLPTRRRSAGVGGGVSRLAHMSANPASMGTGNTNDASHPMSNHGDPQGPHSSAAAPAPGSRAQTDRSGSHACGKAAADADMEADCGDDIEDSASEGKPARRHEHGNEHASHAAGADNGHGFEDLDDPPLSQITWQEPAGRASSAIAPPDLPDHTDAGRPNSAAAAAASPPQQQADLREIDAEHATSLADDHGHGGLDDDQLNGHLYSHAPDTSRPIDRSNSASALEPAGSHASDDLDDPPLSQIRWEEKAKQRGAAANDDGSRQAHDQPHDMSRVPSDEHGVIDIVDDSQEELDEHGAAELSLRRLQQA